MLVGFDADGVWGRLGERELLDCWSGGWGPRRRRTYELVKARIGDAFTKETLVSPVTDYVG